jgi:hypothetical protein
MVQSAGNNEWVIAVGQIGRDHAPAGRWRAVSSTAVLVMAPPTGLSKKVPFR